MGQSRSTCSALSTLLKCSFLRKYIWCKFVVFHLCLNFLKEILKTVHCLWIFEFLELKLKRRPAFLADAESSCNICADENLHSFNHSRCHFLLNFQCIEVSREILDLWLKVMAYSDAKSKGVLDILLTSASRKNSESEEDTMYMKYVVNL